MGDEWNELFVADEVTLYTSPVTGIKSQYPTDKDNVISDWGTVHTDILQLSEPLNLLAPLAEIESLHCTEYGSRTGKRNWHHMSRYQ